MPTLRGHWYNEGDRVSPLWGPLRLRIKTESRDALTYVGSEESCPLLGWCGVVVGCLSRTPTRDPTDHATAKRANRR